jgi:hypothetical protein
MSFIRNLFVTIAPQVTIPEDATEEERKTLTAFNKLLNEEINNVWDRSLNHRKSLCQLLAKLMENMLTLSRSNKKLTQENQKLREEIKRLKA